MNCNAIVAELFIKLLCYIFGQVTKMAHRFVLLIDSLLAMFQNPNDGSRFSPFADAVYILICICSNHYL